MWSIQEHNGEKRLKKDTDKFDNTTEKNESKGISERRNTQKVPGHGQTMQTE